MRICHVSQYCHAGSLGGTERYILELIRGLPGACHDNSILWLTGGKHRDPFEADGVRIIPLYSPQSRIDPASEAFRERAGEILSREGKPDLVHFHTFGLPEADVAEAAAARSIPYVFSYHSPAWTCRRGTLLLWGTHPCDGEVRSVRCAACKLQERLGSRPAAGYAGAVASATFGSILSRAGGKLRRRTAFTADTRRFRNRLRRFLRACSLAVSCCDWSDDVLVRNGTRVENVVHCPQGCASEFVGASRLARLAGGGPEGDDAFVIGFVGRMTPLKGIDILVEGFRRTAYPRARLRVYASGGSDHTATYERKIRTMAETDPRIDLLPSRPFEEMLKEYRRLSLLAIPSVCLETGPLVLFEALQLGVPAWGTDRVGQLQLLKKRGRVVHPNTPAAWQSALEEAFRLHERGEWHGLSDSGSPEAARSMQEVADEMHGHYTALLGSSRVRSPGPQGRRKG